MPARIFPSFRLFKDHRNQWRWRYEIGKDEPIAVSSDSYPSRAECERMVHLLRAAVDAPLWVSNFDLTDA